MTSRSMALYGVFSEVAFGGSQAAVITDTAIRGFLGENFHRVATAAWQGDVSPEANLRSAPR